MSDFARLCDDVKAALHLWHEPDGLDVSPLDYLRLFQQTQLKNGDSARRVTNTLLLQALSRLAVENEFEADLLRRRFVAGESMQAIAGELHLGRSTAYRRLEQAIERLALVLQAQEAELQNSDLERRLHLPPEVHLIGVDEHVAKLRRALDPVEPVWVISIEGLGGIGKTALAGDLLRRRELTDRFHGLGWISAKPQEFLPHLAYDGRPARPTLDAGSLIDSLLAQLGRAGSLAQPPAEKELALTRLLKAEPYLIVIDNLETVADYRALLPLLHKLAKPSKFLLTSRHSLWANPHVFCRTLNELSPADTLEFIRHEARVRGRADLAAAGDGQLGRIYEVVGGNPLALKLVVGQLSIHTLATVLDRLQETGDRDAEKLYTYIYWYAWQQLEPAGRRLLLVMPLVQEAGLEQLAALSGLETAELSRAMQQLANVSLVQISGDLEERTYSIHRLTETFLLKEALKWQPPS